MSLLRDFLHNFLGDFLRLQLNGMDLIYWTISEIIVE